MLPDFPALKMSLHERLWELSDERTNQYLGIWGKVGRHQLHERSGHTLIRDDGSVDEAPSVPILVPIHLEANEMESLTLEGIMQKLDTAAREMALKQSALFDQRFEQAVTEVGNDVNAEGMTEVEAVFALLGTVDLHFNKDGSPDFPQIKQKGGQAWFERVCARITGDPALRQKFIQLIERKKEEFRDRENSRKLVG
jgi:hypothetical protein